MRENERECVCVCVCVCERESESERLTDKETNKKQEKEVKKDRITKTQN